MPDFVLSPSATAEIDGLVRRYPEKQAAMLPVLWVVQREKGWISPDAMGWVGERLGCSAATVQSVVTFYTMLDDAPVGKWKLQVCRTLSCELMGARSVIDRIREKLKIEPGETTTDGLFTLQEVECLASCGSGPMMQCNFRFYENLTPDRVDALLDELRTREPDPEEVEPVVFERPDVEAYHVMFPRSLERERTGGAEVEAQ